MTRVCLVGADDVNLQYELLSRETARDALAAYDLHEPYENTIAVETVSLGAAVALLNDLDWYLVRYVTDAFVLEPSVSEAEWLSRDVATAIRENNITPNDTGRFLRVYGIDEPDSTGAEQQADTGDSQANSDDSQAETTTETTEQTAPRLVEPMLVTRTDEQIPEYDLRDVGETLVVRVTESEFGA